MQTQETTRQLPPFPAFPAVSRYVPIGGIQDTLMRLCRSIDSYEPISAVFGAPGTGKTLLTQFMQQQYVDSHYVVSLPDASLAERPALLQFILHALGENPEGRSDAEMQMLLIDILSCEDSATCDVLLIIDDAQNLPESTLENIRSLTNIMIQGRPRISAVLVGTNKFEEQLLGSGSEPVSQRIATRCYLHPLNTKETRTYVHQTIESCGADPASTINESAIAALHHITNGLPRLINQLMTEAIDIAAETEQTVIDDQIMHSAWASLQQLPDPSAIEKEPAQEIDVEFGELSDFGDSTTYDATNTSDAPPSESTHESCLAEIPEPNASQPAAEHDPGLHEKAIPTESTPTQTCAPPEYADANSDSAISDAFESQYDSMMQSTRTSSAEFASFELDSLTNAEFSYDSNAQHNPLGISSVEQTLNHESQTFDCMDSIIEEALGVSKADSLTPQDDEQNRPDQPLLKTPTPNHLAQNLTESLPGHEERVDGESHSLSRELEVDSLNHPCSEKEMVDQQGIRDKSDLQLETSVLNNEKQKPTRAKWEGGSENSHESITKTDSIHRDDRDILDIQDTDQTVMVDAPHVGNSSMCTHVDDFKTMLQRMRATRTS